MASRINADSSNGLQLVSDSSGEIQFQSSGITKATIGSNGLSSPGHVLQVKQTVSSSTISTTTVDTNIASGLQVSITPSSTSSKMLIMLNGANAWNNTASKNMLLYFYRDGSLVQTGPHAIIQNNANTAGFKSSWSACYLDSPSTTSSVTYEPYFRINSGTGIGYFNEATVTVMLTVMEVAG